MHEESNREQAQVRRENLDELINAGSYVDLNLPTEEDRLAAFLADAALDAGDGQAQEGLDAVQLMTLHSAKGLEFPCVFVVGMEEGLFPGSRALEDADGLEEERRLAYVGMTRARQRLTLCFAERRRFQGKESYPQPSRFIYEIPGELTEAVRPMVYEGINRARQYPAQGMPPRGHGDDVAPFRIGEMVLHAKFGEGCVMALEGRDAHARALINFDGGEKWLVLAYANLRKM